eukprot:g67855.t1
MDIIKPGFSADRLHFTVLSHEQYQFWDSGGNEAKYCKGRLSLLEIALGPDGALIWPEKCFAFLNKNELKPDEPAEEVIVFGPVGILGKASKLKKSCKVGERKLGIEKSGWFSHPMQLCLMRFCLLDLDVPFRQIEDSQFEAEYLGYITPYASDLPAKELKPLFKMKSFAERMREAAEKEAKEAKKQAKQRQAALKTAARLAEMSETTLGDEEGEGTDEDDQESEVKAVSKNKPEPEQGWVRRPPPYTPTDDEIKCGLWKVGNHKWYCICAFCYNARLKYYDSVKAAAVNPANKAYTQEVQRLAKACRQQGRDFQKLHSLLEHFGAASVASLCKQPPANSPPEHLPFFQPASWWGSFRRPVSCSLLVACTVGSFRRSSLDIMLMFKKVGAPLALPSPSPAAGSEVPLEELLSPQNPQTPKVIREALAYDVREQAAIVERNLGRMNDDQLAIFRNPRRCLSVRASLFQLKLKRVWIDRQLARTGKTLLAETLLAAARARRHIALATASSRIAAIMLPGSTAHRTFGLPVPIRENAVSSITMQSDRARLLALTLLIIWDEVIMMQHHWLSCLHRLLCEIVCLDPELAPPMAGVPVLLQGDLRQILPVIVHVRTLRINELVSQRQVQYGTDSDQAHAAESYANFLESLGNGTLPDPRITETPNDLVELPAPTALAPGSTDLDLINSV